MPDIVVQVQPERNVCPGFQLDDQLAIHPVGRFRPKGRSSSAALPSPYIDPGRDQVQQGWGAWPFHFTSLPR